MSTRVLNCQKAAYYIWKSSGNKIWKKLKYKAQNTANINKKSINSRSLNIFSMKQSLWDRSDELKLDSYHKDFWENLVTLYPACYIVFNFQLLR